MVAFAMHLLWTTSTQEVLVIQTASTASGSISPAGSGGAASTKPRAAGRTDYGGRYSLPDGRRIIVNPTSGKGDVVAEVDGVVLSAECKGGIVNTRHPGQVSRLYKGLCETVGLLMASPSPGRQIAVVPRTDGTLRLAKRLAPRCVVSGIEIALVGRWGEIEMVGA
jgi:hypothetical protein